MNSEPDTDTANLEQPDVPSVTLLPEHLAQLEAGEVVQATIDHDDGWQEPVDVRVAADAQWIDADAAGAPVAVDRR